MTNSNRSPKNKFRAQITFHKPLSEVGSSISFTSNKPITSDHAWIKRAANDARKAKTTFGVRVWENQANYPEFDWKPISYNS